MTWNYRIMKHVNETDFKESAFGLHEAHYNEAGEVNGWTEHSMFGLFETPEELIETLEMMLRDAKRFKDSILDYNQKGQ